MKLPILTIATLTLTLTSTIAFAQTWHDTQHRTYSQETRQVSNRHSAPMDPYSFCYFEGRAYSEGTHLNGVSKCMVNPNPDASGRHRLYWESNFYKQ